MFENVKKLVARFDEREVVDSTWEEMQEFMVNQKRPDFMDDEIICIKFLITDNDDLVDAEETSWFINPSYLYRKCRHLYCISQVVTDSYGPKMAAEFFPEILLIKPPDARTCIFEQYSEFYLEIMSEPQISDTEKRTRFITFLKERFEN